MILDGNYKIKTINGNKVELTGKTKDSRLILTVCLKIMNKDFNHPMMK